MGLLLPLGCDSWEEAANPPPTVGHVDLTRYMGTWYEIASFPAPFQRDCFCTQARYQILEEGEVEVLNTCRKGSPSGSMEVAKGIARVVPASGNSKLEVQFFGPFKGDYWVIGLDPEYHWALVGTPSRKYLWVLSRSPKMDEGTLKRIVDIAKEKGFEVERLTLTVQECPEAKGKR